jgi:hypothetical protein
MALRFEWDPRKARRNLRDHRVSFEEAATAPLTMRCRSRCLTLSIRSARSASCSSGERLVAASSSLPLPSAAPIFRAFDSSQPDSPTAASAVTMKKVSRKPRAPSRAITRKTASDEILPHYDFRGGVRGKYAAPYREGTNVVLLEPDVAARFPDAASVNRALRALAEIADETKPKSRSRRRTA